MADIIFEEWRGYNGPRSLKAYGSYVGGRAFVSPECSDSRTTPRSRWKYRLWNNRSQMMRNLAAIYFPASFLYTISRVYDGAVHTIGTTGSLEIMRSNTKYARQTPRHLVQPSIKKPAQISTSLQLAFSTAQSEWLQCALRGTRFHD